MSVQMVETKRSRIFTTVNEEEEDSAATRTWFSINQAMSVKP